MIDVHMLIGLTERAEWRRKMHRQMLAEGVPLHVEQAIRDQTNAARLAAFEHGICDWVSWVDPDDEIIPGIFETLAGVLASRPDAVGAFTWEAHISETGKTLMASNSGQPLPQRAHHLVVVRRDLIAQIRAEASAAAHGIEQMIVAAARRSDRAFIEIPRVGYRWRLHRDNAHANYGRLAPGGAPGKRHAR